MVTRVYFVPGIILLFCAFILSLLVTISVPKLPALDIVRFYLTITSSGPWSASDTDLRFGVWGKCSYHDDVHNGVPDTCLYEGIGYTSQIRFSNVTTVITIGPGSTRRLAIHPVATVATFIALLFSLSSHVTLAPFVSLLSFVASLFTLLACAFDIALYIDVRDKTRHGFSGTQVHTVTAPGFWFTVASFILLLMATWAMWLGRRRSRMAGATENRPSHSEKPGFFDRYRRS